jgi:hypothetical protein
MIFVTHELPVSGGAPDIPAPLADIHPSQPFNTLSITAWRPMSAVNVESTSSPARYSRGP